MISHDLYRWLKNFFENESHYVVVLQEIEGINAANHYLHENHSPQEPTITRIRDNAKLFPSPGTADRCMKEWAINATYEVKEVLLRTKVLLA